mmetsp:Transcript_73656/g.204794  ORF Transcript_73656/g.204794 Transcript_73656/m.204794 type:complete len:212 (+) Transcript_73656:120-755(+)
MHDDPVSCLLSMCPEALVVSSGWPREDPEPMLLVVLVLATIASSVPPDVHACAIYRRLVPAALESTLVVAVVFAPAVHGVALPLAAVLCTIRPAVDSMAVLFPVHEKAHVAGAFSVQGLDTVAFLEVVPPLAHVIRAVLVIVCAMPLCYAGPPLSDVQVPIEVAEPSHSLHLVGCPLALEDCTIRPRLYTEALPLVAAPLACVRGPRIESD